MIFNQLFDEKSHTYTYIISSGKGREALIIDPVIEKTNEYLEVLKNLKLKLEIKFNVTRINYCGGNVKLLVINSMSSSLELTKQRWSPLIWLFLY